MSPVAEGPLAQLARRSARPRMLGAGLLTLGILLGVGGYVVMLFAGGAPSDPCVPDDTGCGGEPALWLFPWALGAQVVSAVAVVIGFLLLIVPPLRREQFNPPPGWPDPPPAWRPHPGWQPDPAWPEPPEGWLFWGRRR